jgi:hypothetical protein
MRNKKTDITYIQNETVFSILAKLILNNIEHSIPIKHLSSELKHYFVKSYFIFPLACTHEVLPLMTSGRSLSFPRPGKMFPPRLPEKESN